jgi:dTDP-4-amino-4,6-dideoxygalactose transaminase
MMTLHMHRDSPASPRLEAQPKRDLPPIRIPFNKPFLTGYEFVYISQAISGGHTAGDGPFTKKCQELLGSMLGSPKVLLTTSCTDALEMAALLLQLEEGDEVIVPSFTFVSTANAFAIHGARPVFADIDPVTLNLDPDSVESKITRRTRAIVPVHYAGVGCDMDRLVALAKKHNLTIIEDNAHGLMGRYRGRALGSFGQLATQSFHETKNIICGEGGALVMNDPAFVERAEILREKGTNRSRFYRGQVDKYTWVDYGSSFLPSDILAAYLFAQLESRRLIQDLRKRIWERYAMELAEWAMRHNVRLPVIPAHCEHPYHMFYLLLPDGKSRDGLIAHLRARGMLAVFHYQSLHMSDMGLKFGGKPGDCPVTESVSERLVRLPFYNALSEEEQASVIGAITEYRGFD